MIVTRFHNLEKLTLGVEFLSPTFLGGADQEAELRSAPFKNLLRQWWRVANGHLSANELRLEEGKLFGTVLGDNSAHASQVRLVLEKGKRFAVSSEMPQIGMIEHPEVRNRAGNPIAIDRRLYLGYGPVTTERIEGRTSCKIRKFIQPGSLVKASVYIPKNYIDVFKDTLSLLFYFGTFGSRSRNGYGSISLLYDPDKLTLKSLTDIINASIFFDDRMNGDGLNKNYPSQLCSDNNGLLCWEYAVNSNDISNAWQDIFKNFAEIYMQTRTQFAFQFANQLERRHLLGYPSGRNHAVADWGSRMPSQLRLMVKRNDQRQIVGRILHLAHPIPKKWDNKLGTQTDIWKKVHSFLDGQPSLKRCGGV